MAKNDDKLNASIGFVTVLEDEVHGFFGGFLILNISGRPLEFHCTVPVKISRAQEILYGSTLKPYIYGEQIAQSLIVKTSLQPIAIFTDLPEVLAVQPEISQPVLMVVEPDATSLLTDSEGQSLESVELSGNRLAAYSSVLEAEQGTIDSLSDCISRLDLNEPFERIRDAILEAQKTGRKAA